MMDDCMVISMCASFCDGRDGEPGSPASRRRLYIRERVVALGPWRSCVSRLSAVVQTGTVRADVGSPSSGLASLLVDYGARPVMATRIAFWDSWTCGRPTIHRSPGRRH